MVGPLGTWCSAKVKLFGPFKTLYRDKSYVGSSCVLNLELGMFKMTSAKNNAVNTLITKGPMFEKLSSQNNNWMKKLGSQIYGINTSFIHKFFLFLVSGANMIKGVMIICLGDFLGNCLENNGIVCKDHVIAIDYKMWWIRHTCFSLWSYIYLYHNMLHYYVKA